ncbi:YafY family protein [Fusibacter sp. 3D3]|uniref:helix-turn-helix transcriptional regulator n=1 Tax=Fusibacter sp. 3D3 TaxID=1048380 RepID=UPI000853985A|nr:YafY family protein [Fusibacter sp. 3D3]GAU76019.1 transcriptional regulator [Fusibacter sp. 3D3]
MKKAERLNGVIFSLKERGRLTGKQLADIFEVSERTIYRDIDALSQLKVPIISYEGFKGGYEIEDDYFIPSIKLNEDEAMLLLMILKLGRDINFPNYKSDYELLRSKIVNTLNNRDQSDAEKLLKRISFYVSYINPANYADGILKAITTALIHRKQLEFIYYSPVSDQRVRRQVSPQELFFEAGAWYLSAYCHLRQAKRVFRLDRMMEIAVHAEANEHMDEVISSVSDKFKRRTYTLKISRSLYRILKENDYFKDSKVLEDGDMILIQVTTRQEQEITNIVLENPETITVLGPSEYLIQIKHIVEQLKKKYK